MKSTIPFTVAILWLTLVFSYQPVFSEPERRAALVIGNGSYKISPLVNPVNDAQDIAKILEELGFVVTVKTNADQRSMEEAIYNFGKELRKGGTGLFYFAGHGLQVQGRNYLIPIGANIRDEFDVKYEAVDAGRVLGKMENAGNEMNIIILDACRNNPFSKDFRSSGSGLLKMDAPTGSILAYSTAPGSVAADGIGRNGLYTSKLLKYLPQKGLTIEDCFKKVRIEVMLESENKQIPWESSSLTKIFYFVRNEILNDTKPNDNSAELLYWESIKDSKDVDQYKLYVKQFPNGVFSELANLYIEKLSTKNSPKKLDKKQNPIIIHKNIHNSHREIVKIALFPFKTPGSYFHTHCVGCLENSIEGIVAAIDKFESIEITHSYYDMKLNTNIDNSNYVFLDQTYFEEIDDFWSKENFFSTSRPVEKKLLEQGIKLDVDIVLTCYFYILNGEDTINIYMYDINNKIILIKKGSTYSFSQQGRRTIEILLSELINDYLTSNR